MYGEHKRSRGASLIEVIVFIVVVSVAAAGVLGALQWSARASPDPMIRKQLLAIAESMLEEITLQPFTWCDPTDANVATATSAAGCATLAEAIGPEAGESRYSPTAPFNNVNDYHGFAMTGIRNVLDAAIAGLESYSLGVSVQDATLAAAAGAGAPALRVIVTVEGPANARVVMESFRTRHAPNAIN
ncbi:MAG: prepilin-type N-terminal cleavage/methylation domain-containing protein [Proteobacteria bacterium]|nr:prepilin-type N-terminal cleavage/methylation domain-containing protein [Burkholderiales bacterium]